MTQVNFIVIFCKDPCQLPTKVTGNRALACHSKFLIQVSCSPRFFYIWQARRWPQSYVTGETSMQSQPL